jgi:hypothetical protein
VCEGRVGHVVAKTVREVCWINAGINPAPYAVCNTERDVRGGADARDEEGILTTGGTGAFIFAACADVVVGVEGKDVGFGVVTTVFSRKGGGDTVGNLCSRWW